MATVVLASCGGDSTGGSGSTRPAAETAPAEVRLTPAERQWFERLKSFTIDLSVSLVALSRVSGGWEPPTAHLDFDPKVFDRDSEERGVLVAVAFPRLLRCTKQLRRRVPAAPSARMAAIRAHVADACREFELGVSFIVRPVLLAHDDRDVPRDAVEAADQALAAGFASLRKADGAARRALGQ